jgi:hypothetical protein
MASDDRPKLPRATLRDEKLYVEGEKEPYFRDREQSVWLRVEALTISRGYAPNQTRKPFLESLHGIAKLEERDRFAVIGLETDPTTPIQFRLESVPDTETKFHWRANINFHAHDREAANEGEYFWISGYCTSQYFDDLLAAVRRGHVDNIRVGMETTMWTLAAPIDGEAERPAYEFGHISSLIWEEKFGLHPPEETKDAAIAPKPQRVELPARVYSMLSALIGLVAALLVLTFLRH